MIVTQEICNKETERKENKVLKGRTHLRVSWIDRVAKTQNVIWCGCK